MFSTPGDKIFQHPQTKMYSRGQNISIPPYCTLFSITTNTIDFKSGYHLIPFTESAKQAVAFSPGYKFLQLTWTVMPQTWCTQ